MDKSVEEYELFLRKMKKKELERYAFHQESHIHYLQSRVEDLESQLKDRNQTYMAGCRSSGGVTLPPGM